MVAAVMVALLHLPACRSGNVGTDGGLLLDALGREGILPPDVWRDGPRWTGNENVGGPCTPGSGAGGGCTGQAVCLDVGRGVGVCTVGGCTLEDLSTPVLEDNCPMVRFASGSSARTVCTRVPVAGGQFCLVQCTPDATRNACLLDSMQSTKLTCDPISLLLNEHSEVCLFAACTKNSECGNGSLTDPDSTCIAPTGVCRVNGTPGAKVGSPCKVSADCGAGQYCYGERTDRGGRKAAQNGYCTVVGCKYQGPWTCPAGSQCYTIGSPASAISMCLATGCDPKAARPDPAFCRADANPGQYDCTVQGSNTVCWLSASK